MPFERLRASVAGDREWRDPEAPPDRRMRDRGAWIDYMLHLGVIEQREREIAAERYGRRLPPLTVDEVAPYRRRLQGT